MTKPYPSSEQFAELEELRNLPEGRERSSGIWRLLGETYGNSDHAIVLDYALENDLVGSCEEAASAALRDDPPRRMSWINPADGSQMIWIPAGSFFVGPKKDKNLHSSLGFSLARHPVANAQFAEFLSETNYVPHSPHPDENLFFSNWENGPPRGLEQHPVVWVSCLDALAYCRWAGLTLPTEWLWEKAARGPAGPPFPWGDTSPMDSGLANVRSAGTLPVGSFPRTRSAYGCEDMIGNVSEWCRMTEDVDYGRIPQTQPDLSTSTDAQPIYAAVRGSAYLRTSRLHLSAWHRRRLSVIRRNRWVGFRPACFLPYYPK